MTVNKLNGSTYQKKKKKKKENIDGNKIKKLNRHLAGRKEKLTPSTRKENALEARVNVFHGARAALHYGRQKVKECAQTRGWLGV